MLVALSPDLVVEVTGLRTEGELMKKLYLVDGHSYLYRAFYAIKNLSTRQGVPTGAVFGFINMMLKIIEEHPDMLIVTFDSPVPSFRVEKYSEYKIYRKSMPDDLIATLTKFKKY